MNATLTQLRSLPNPRYSPAWPEGTRQPLTKELAQYYFDLVSTCDTSLLQLLQDHPELPPFKQLDYWRRHNKNGFADQWKDARKKLRQISFSKNAWTSLKIPPLKYAHATRVKFDIYRWLVAKFHPEVYGDKPTAPTSTTLNVGIAISPERLQEIRNKLDITRSAFLKAPSGNAKPLP